MFCACGKHYFSLKFLLKHFFACLFEKVAEKLHAAKKEDWNGRRKGIVRPELLSKEERAELIRRNPSYGTIICRCENVSEGEIVDAINRTLGAKSLDGIKRHGTLSGWLLHTANHGNSFKRTWNQHGRGLQECTGI